MVGHFLSTDPIGYEDGLNVYAYVGNNTVNKIDPNGLQTDTIKDQSKRKIKTEGRDIAQKKLEEQGVPSATACQAAHCPNAGSRMSCA